MEYAEIQVIKKIKKDSHCFTQGIAWYNNKIYCSCGEYGSSSLSRIGEKTSAVESKILLNRKYFAEDITIKDDFIYMLTWKERSVLKFDLTFNLKRVYNSYPIEGWGITSMDNGFITTSGTNTLHRINKNLDNVEHNTIVHYRPQQSLLRLNAIENINSYIYANSLGSQDIYKINYSTGNVEMIIRCKELLLLEKINHHSLESKPLNGITYNYVEDILYVTGKCWLWIYGIRLVDTSKTLKLSF